MEKKNFSERLDAIQRECVEEIVRLVKNAGGRVYFGKSKPRFVAVEYDDYCDDEILEYQHISGLSVVDGSLEIYIEERPDCPMHYGEMWYYDIFTIYDSLVEHLSR